MQSCLRGVIFVILVLLSSCQSASQIALPTDTAPAPAIERQPSPTPAPTAAQIPFSANRLAGLISSPILDIAFELPGGKDFLCAGPRQEILTSGIFQNGITQLAAWSSFVPGAR